MKHSNAQHYILRPFFGLQRGKPDSPPTFSNFHDSTFFYNPLCYYFPITLRCIQVTRGLISENFARISPFSLPIRPRVPSTISCLTQLN